MRAIGSIVGVSASTVSRELRRQRYNYILAERLAEIRRYEAGSQFKKLKGHLERHVLEGLYQLWSPEQISGRLKLEGTSISPESIYQYIRKKGLKKYLRHQGKRYKRVKTEDAGEHCIPNRVDISRRPSIIDDKVRIGDWEGNTVISHGSRCALMTLVDRHSKYTIIRKIGRKTADNLNQTATFDNDKEFAKHQELARKLKTSIYFARPYKSCDRGLNEHTNGLIRQFLPKNSISEMFLSIISDY